MQLVIEYCKNAKKNPFPASNLFQTYYKTAFWPLTAFLSRFVVATNTKVMPTTSATRKRKIYYEEAE